MVYRSGNRNHLQFLPTSIEEYVTPDDPVRVYDTFVEALDLEKLGFNLDPHQVGNPAYHPKVMLKLLVYGYASGIWSSRKLEEATHYNLSFIWLTSGLKPDHKTIAEFRRKNRSQVAEVLKQCAYLCIMLNLIEGNALFLDDSNLKANSSIKKCWDKNKTQKVLKQIDQRIVKLLSECDKQDEAEGPLGSIIQFKEDNETPPDKICYAI